MDRYNIWVKKLRSMSIRLSFTNLSAKLCSRTCRIWNFNKKWRGSAEILRKKKYKKVKLILNIKCIEKENFQLPFCQLSLTLLPRINHIRQVNLHLLIFKTVIRWNKAKCCWEIQWVGIWLMSGNVVKNKNRQNRRSWV